MSETRNVLNRGFQHVDPTFWLVRPLKVRQLAYGAPCRARQDLVTVGFILETEIFYNGSFNFDRVLRLALFAGLTFSLVFLLDYLSDVLLPFVTGLVIAYFLNPITNRVQQVLKSRVLSSLFTLFSITLILSLIHI